MINLQHLHPGLPRYKTCLFCGEVSALLCLGAVLRKEGPFTEQYISIHGKPDNLPQIIICSSAV